jgi:hypothetical protein
MNEAALMFHLSRLNRDHFPLRPAAGPLTLKFNGFVRSAKFDGARYLTVSLIYLSFPLLGQEHGWRKRSD